MPVVTTARPRIWLTPASLANLKARAAANDDRWLQCKQAADQPADWSNGLLNLALAYVVTTDPTYAQKALSLLMPSAADGLAAVTPDSGYQCRNALPAIAVCFDWLYPVLTPTQKTTLIATMKLWGAWPWPETTPSRVGAWGVDDPGSNYYHAFLFSWMVGLSLSGDDPIADTLIGVARNRFTTEVLPYLAISAKGGLFFEGCGYGVGSSGFLLWNLLANLSATGEDLISSTPFCSELVSAMIQFTKPALTEMAPFGDLASGPESDYDRRVMLAMSGHDNRCAPWLDSITPSRDLQMLTRWEEFLWYTPAAAAPPPQPTFYVASGIGAITSRTDWTTKGTQLLAVCGTTTESHQDRAQGSFLVAAGNDWLAGQAKMLSHTGLRQDAIDHCCLTVDGARQAQTQDGCHYLQQEDTPQYTYLAMDLAGAYQGQLSAYTRELFWLKPGCLLVVDWPTPVNPASILTWNLNVLDQPVVDLIGFAVVGDHGGKLFGTAGLPSKAFTSAQVPLETSQQRPSYRLTLTGSSFVVGLEVAPASQAARTITSFTPTGAAGMICGSSLILQGTVPLTYLSPVQGTHYLVTGLPSTAYSVMGSPVVSSPAGVLVLDGPAVGQSVTITEGAAPPPVNQVSYKVISGTFAPGETIVLQPLPDI